MQPLINHKELPEVLHQRKLAKLQASHINGGNLNNVRRKTSRALRSSFFSKWMTIASQERLLCGVAWLGCNY